MALAGHGLDDIRTNDHRGSDILAAGHRCIGVRSGAVEHYHRAVFQFARVHDSAEVARLKGEDGTRGSPDYFRVIGYHFQIPILT